MLSYSSSISSDRSLSFYPAPAIGRGFGYCYALPLPELLLSLPTLPYKELATLDCPARPATLDQGISALFSYYFGITLGRPANYCRLASSPSAQAR